MNNYERFALKIHHDQNLRTILVKLWLKRNSNTINAKDIHGNTPCNFCNHPFIYAFVSYAGLKYKDVFRCVRCYARAEKLMKVLVFKHEYIALALAILHLALFSQHHHYIDCYFYSKASNYFNRIKDYFLVESNVFDWFKQFEYRF